MSQQKQKVIFFPIHPTSWPTMHHLALKMKEEGFYDPVMLLTQNVAHHKSLCQQEGLEVYFFEAVSSLASSLQKTDTQQQQKSVAKKGFSIKALGVSWAKQFYTLLKDALSALEQKTKGRVLSYSIYHLCRVLVETVYLKMHLKLNQKLLDTLKPVAVYIYVDNAGGSIACLISLCYQRKIKIIIPAAAFQHEEIMAKRREKNAYTHLKGKGTPWINRVIAHYWPEQFLDFNGSKILFYLPYEILAMHFCGILPRFPWVRGKNASHVLCVEDYYQYQRLLMRGVDEKKMKVIGHVDCDQLWAVKNSSTREEICQQYHFDPAKKIIIVSPSQLKQEGYVATWEEHWKETESMISTATATGENVLIALHPKFDRKDYLYLEGKYPCKINQSNKTSDIIPWGDIYVSAGSSTNFWALLCGLVVIDCYGIHCQGEKIITYLRSLVNVASYQELSSWLMRLTHEPETWLQQKSLVEQDQKEFCPPLDGLNTQKYLNLVKEQTI